MDQLKEKVFTEVCANALNRFAFWLCTTSQSLPLLYTSQPSNTNAGEGLEFFYEQHQLLKVYSVYYTLYIYLNTLLVEAPLLSGGDISSCYNMLVLKYYIHCT